MAQHYQIQASRNGVQLPTFYLNSDVQGIMDPLTAAKVASDVLLDDTDLASAVAFTVYEPSSGYYVHYGYRDGKLTEVAS